MCVLQLWHARVRQSLVCWASAYSVLSLSLSELDCLDTDTLTPFERHDWLKTKKRGAVVVTCILYTIARATTTMYSEKSSSSSNAPRRCGAKCKRASDVLPTSTQRRSIYWCYILMLLHLLSYILSLKPSYNCHKLKPITLPQRLRTAQQLPPSITFICFNNSWHQSVLNYILVHSVYMLGYTHTHARL